MPDVHIRIELAPDNEGNLGKALAFMHQLEPAFCYPSWSWWNGARPNARGWVARHLSAFGCRGRLSVEEPVPGALWNETPPPCWTGFQPRKKK